METLISIVQLMREMLKILPWNTLSYQNRLALALDMLLLKEQGACEMLNLTHGECLNIVTMLGHGLLFLIVGLAIVISFFLSSLSSLSSISM